MAASLDLGEFDHERCLMAAATLRVMLGKISDGGPTDGELAKAFRAAESGIRDMIRLTKGIFELEVTNWPR